VIVETSLEADNMEENNHSWAQGDARQSEFTTPEIELQELTVEQTDVKMKMTLKDIRFELSTSNVK
jgi:hypothetical protein